MKMLVQACDHSFQDAVIARDGRIVGVIEGGFNRGTLIQAARERIAAVYGVDPALHCFPGRFTLDLPDHDQSHPGLLEESQLMAGK